MATAHDFDVGIVDDRSRRLFGNSRIGTAVAGTVHFAFFLCLLGGSTMFETTPVACGVFLLVSVMLAGCGGEAGTAPCPGGGSGTSANASSTDDTHRDAGAPSTSAPSSSSTQPPSSPPTSDTGTPSSTPPSGTGSPPSSGSGTTQGTGAATEEPGKCIPNGACGGILRCIDHSYGEDKCYLDCECRVGESRLSCVMDCN